MITDEQLAKDREPIPYVPVKQLRRGPLYVRKRTVPHPTKGYSVPHDEYSVIDLVGYRKGYEPRLEILGQYIPNPDDLFRLATGHLPPYQPTATGDKVQAEMTRLGVHEAFRIGEPEGARILPVISEEEKEQIKRRHSSNMQFVKVGDRIRNIDTRFLGFRDIKPWMELGTLGTVDKYYPDFPGFGEWAHVKWDVGDSSGIAPGGEQQYWERAESPPAPFIEELNQLRKSWKAGIISGKDFEEAIKAVLASQQVPADYPELASHQKRSKINCRHFTGNGGWCIPVNEGICNSCPQFKAK